MGQKPGVAIHPSNFSNIGLNCTLHNGRRRQMLCSNDVVRSTTNGSAVNQDGQCRYKRDIETRSRNHCWRGKGISIAYSEYVFLALGTQYAKRMRRYTLSSVVCSVLLYSSTLFTNGTFFVVGGGDY
jgi:hypothetical protein